jgi:hypothetical protein
MASAGDEAFVMHSTREALAAGLGHMQQQVKALELAVRDNSGYAFDLARTLVESACRTILVERFPTRKAEFEKMDAPPLFKTAAQSMPLVPADASKEADARRSLKQTIDGLHSAFQGVCELRNAYGFSSHGKDGTRAAMESTQAVLAAQTADAIVGFLFGLHRGALMRRDRQTVNAVIDYHHEAIDILGKEFLFSEVLFAVDKDGYEALASAVTQSRNVLDDLSQMHPDCLTPEVTHVGFVHYDGNVFVKVVNEQGQVQLDDTSFISGDGNDKFFFKPTNTPDQNADRLVFDFDGYSIINCFPLFSEDAAKRIAAAYEAERNQEDSTSEPPQSTTSAT